MTATINELQKLTGVGEATAQRLAAAGLDTFSAIVAAGEEGLRAIPGINPRKIPGILEQAAASVASDAPSVPEPADDLKTSASEPAIVDDLKTAESDAIGELKTLAAELRSAMQEIAQAVRDRFPEELTDKIGHKLTRSMVAGVDALYAMEELAERRPKRSRRALEKTRKRLSGLAQGELAEILKGLKRARKGLERALS